MVIRVAAALAALGTALSTVLGLAGCGSAEPAAGDRVRVVASTDVWGSVAAAVGGDAVEVTSIVSDPAADPHSHQLTPRDAAALAEADLVVFNGGGYDDFVGLALSDQGQATVEAFALAGHETGGGHGAGRAGHGDNEHVWYRLLTVAAVADAIADQLAQLRPEDADRFRAGAASFRSRIDELTGRVERIAATAAGTPVLATEPVAYYLLQDAGLRDVTPAEFVEAVEEETDPPAAAVAEIQDLVRQRQAMLLVHNPQTETPVITDVLTKAREAQLPVVELTETLPAGQDYVTWMTGQIDTLAKAIGPR